MHVLTLCHPDVCVDICADMCADVCVDMCPTESQCSTTDPTEIVRYFWPSLISLGAKDTPKLSNEP